MINLCNRTEYSFRLAFGHLGKVLDANPEGYAGICDRHGTWGHVAFEKQCKKRNKKAILGVELACVDDPTLREKQGSRFIRFIALNNSGLNHLYRLVTRATEQFYFFPRIGIKDIEEFATDGIIVLTSRPIELNDMSNVYLDLSPATKQEGINWAIKNKIQPIASSDNFYPTIEDQHPYEVCIGRNSDSKTTPMHILDKWQWSIAIEAPDDFKEQALKNAEAIAIKSEASLPKAKLVHPEVTQTLRQMCEAGGKVRGCDLNRPAYKARLDRELELIAEKDFEDYFFLIGDLVQYAKQHMLVGPARGSSCGSLVCYLLRITDIDPIPYDLLFERFIDINRKDLPDIDIDFPEDKRDMVFEYLRDKYGSECVAQLGTVSRYKPKVTIGDVSKELNIPLWEVQDLKDAIIERSGGDARASFCILDTFKELEIGKRLLEKYPELKVAADIEGHARHSGKHAAGIVVTADPVFNYCSVDVNTGSTQVDKYDAEELNLLKIDALGLRTLTLIQDCLDQIGMSREELLNWPLDDVKAFDVLNDKRFSGIFQFEGYALQSLCHQMTVENFEDVVSLTALARPGPLVSGMANEWLKRRTGEKEIAYEHPILASILKDSLGVVIYQENIMRIIRDIGGLGWDGVSAIRKAMSKSLGKEFFNTYKDSFLEGAVKNGFEKDQASDYWERMCNFGSWAFNRCLAGSTEIKLALPNQFTGKSMTIEDMYDKYFYEPNHYRKNHKPLLISLESDGRCRPQHLINIHKNGKKECWEFTFSNDSKISCTKDHMFMIDGEWKPIHEAKIGSKFKIGLYEKINNNSGKGKGHSKGRKCKNKKEGFGTGEENISWVNGKSKFFKQFKILNKNNPCEDCGCKEKRMEAHHNDFSRGELLQDDLSWLCSACHKKRHYNKGRTKQWQKGYGTDDIELVNAEYKGIVETYDIEMPTHHNFLLENGLITHNSHAVAYGTVSYWCLVLKTHHPLEYAVACLRHSKDEEQQIRLLRELHNEGYQYKSFDPDLSEENWSVKNGIILGGLLGVKGIGQKTATSISRLRAEGKPLSPKQRSKLLEATTPYDMIFEAKERWGDVFDNPLSYGISSRITFLRDITQESDGEFVIIAKLKEKNLRDHNEDIEIKKRGGSIMRGPTLFLNMKLEDDTESINAGVSRYDYEKYGKPIIETCKAGDWFIMKGYVRKGFRKLYVKRWWKMPLNKK